MNPYSVPVPHPEYASSHGNAFVQDDGSEGLNAVIASLESASTAISATRDQIQASLLEKDRHIEALERQLRQQASDFRQTLDTARAQSEARERVLASRLRAAEDRAEHFEGLAATANERVSVQELQIARLEQQGRLRDSEAASLRSQIQQRARRLHKMRVKAAEKRELRSRMRCQIRALAASGRLDKAKNAVLRSQVRELCSITTSLQRQLETSGLESARLVQQLDAKLQRAAEDHKCRSQALTSEIASLRWQLAQNAQVHEAESRRASTRELKKARHITMLQKDIDDMTVAAQRNEAIQAELQGRITALEESSRKTKSSLHEHVIYRVATNAVLHSRMNRIAELESQNFILTTRLETQTIRSTAQTRRNAQLRRQLRRHYRCTRHQGLETLNG